MSRAIPQATKTDAPRLIKAFRTAVLSTAIVLAANTVHAKEALVELGPPSVLIALDLISASWNKEGCQSTAEARRGVMVEAAPIVIGGAIGAAEALLFGREIVTDAAVGAFAGDAVARLMRKRLKAIGEEAATPASYTRAVQRAICVAYQGAAKARAPMVRALVLKAGAACGFTAEEFSDTGAVGMTKLKQCALTRPKVQQLGDDFLQGVYEVNHASCMSAQSEIEVLTEEYAQRAEAAGLSFLPNVYAPCSNSILDSLRNPPQLQP